MTLLTKKAYYAPAMFSGIVEAQSTLLSQAPSEPSQPLSLTRIRLKKPEIFNDLRLGDSIAVNGVCLTLEEQAPDWMQFALGQETLKLTKGFVHLTKTLNLERSLKFNDRVHGHLVTGHVDGVAEVLESKNDQGSWILKIKLPGEFSSFVWRKGSLALNGVSLTINSIEPSWQNNFSVLEFCLIPETVQRTNLGQLKKGDDVLFEVDSMARALAQAVQARIHKGSL